MSEKTWKWMAIGKNSLAVQHTHIMKTIRTVMVAAGIFCFGLLVNAQLAPYGILNPDSEGDGNNSADSIVQLTADAQGLPVVTPDQTPFSGTFWTIVPDFDQALPFPCPVPGQTLPTYALPDGSYMVDDSFTTNALSQATLEMQAAMVIALIDQANANVADAQPNVTGRTADDFPGSPGGGGGTNIYTPFDLTNDIAVDYGTNLFIAQEHISGGYFDAIGTNTIADVEYEVQTCTNLDEPINWMSQGFILGSETTNWTSLNPLPFGYTGNFFVRLRSWIDSDNVGIPDWWQLEYFGYIGIDPTADPAGDGWSNAQKFELGWNPHVFYTPPAPQPFSATYDGIDTVSVNWSPSPGAVTGYVLEKQDYQTGDTTTFTFAANSNNFVDNLSADIPYDGPLLTVIYSLNAVYGTNGNSSPATARLGWNAPILGSLITGPQGRLYFQIQNPPSDLIALRVYRQNGWGIATGYYDDYANDAASSTSPLSNGYFEIPAAMITNGLCVLPDSQAAPFFQYNFWVQLERSNNVYSDWSEEYQNVANLPFADARSQLKDNLRFSLRASDPWGPFAFGDAADNLFSMPLNYVYSGFYSSGNYGYYTSYNDHVNPFATFAFDPLRPIFDNCNYRNFVYAADELDTTGLLNTGCSYNPDVPTYIGYNNSSLLWLGASPTYYFDIADYLVATNPVVPSSQITTNDSTWILPPLGGNNASVGEGNFYGLPYVSEQCAYVTNNQVFPVVVYPGDTSYDGSGFYIYQNIAQPVFQTNGYYFARVGTDPMPEQSSFSPSNTTPVMYVGVGNSLTIAGYAVLSVSNTPCYLAQYFQYAYAVDSSGTVTTNTTGLLSPYGNFYATAPGQVALVTMPDIDTGERGTCMVCCVSLQLDKNHDGIMDPSFNGVDFPSQGSPMQFWCNNNSDRWHTVDFTDKEQDDLPLQDSPDYDYAVLGDRAIPCTRDLEDFSRLWISGITSNLLDSLAYGSSVTLSWANEGYATASEPTIDLFQAADSNGGFGYLTNSATAATQTNHVTCPYVGRLAPGGSIQLNSLENNLATTHFIWCGVSNGLGGLTLTISDPSNNILAQTTTYIQIQDIKQMYERWTVGDAPFSTPTNRPYIAQDNLYVGEPTFQFAKPTSTNTSYILHVHGWNMTSWAKDRFAESEYKRLYWQGYQGRFGEFRWPTLSSFPLAAFQIQSFDLDNYDLSEFAAWQSGAGLLNLLTNLDSEYSGHVYLTAHSMGNYAAGEALRLAGTNRVVNTYIAMQAAVPAQCYDAAATPRTIPYLEDDGTPNCYAHYWTNGAPSYFYGTHGAGTYINFFNTNDYALSSTHWQLNQNLKPDDTLSYSYDSRTTNFYRNTTALTFPANTYEIFAFCDEARCYALGAQPNVEGAFDGNQLELDLAPYNFGNTHKFHSGEFRSDSESRWDFWTQIMVGFQLKSP